MRAKDLMTTKVVAVAPTTQVKQVAQLMLRHRISAVPVVDNGKLVGIVSEGDLMRRVEAGTERHRSWWLDLIATPEDRAYDYVKSHAQQVGDLMTKDVVTIDEDTPVAKVAELLETKRIKRVPVMHEGRIVGIVSRADLLHGIATAKLDKTPPGDEAIREAVVSRLHDDAGVRDWLVNVTVTDGVVHLWGTTRSDIEKRAARVAAETVAGVRGVDDHLAVLPDMIAE